MSDIEKVKLSIFEFRNRDNAYDDHVFQINEITGFDKEGNQIQIEDLFFEYQYHTIEQLKEGIIHKLGVDKHNIEIE
ncbi:hypothetical protein MUN88_03225 [Gracilibacillus caseinilyticus]|uniref:Uncharacterized protein n=1 Tax=Gracilibacillus caseinilyticus TaxID=2932256 RepID=A0ABY4EY18_9BACI|nr:hypothetical protein [Gracilibacillus caseinilyticus]UOQ49153.1 hypothetical protein MUN88_03225 [Gracilibacillus caseinilyticus]